jgi:hypothetical protein
MIVCQSAARRLHLFPVMAAGSLALASMGVAWMGGEDGDKTFSNWFEGRTVISPLRVNAASRWSWGIPRSHLEDKDTSLDTYDFVVLGYGHAGQSAIATLQEQCPHASVAVIDPFRSLLSSITKDSPITPYQTAAQGFNPQSKSVTLVDGRSIYYRHGILVATGCRGAPPPMELIDREIQERILELRPTEISGYSSRPLMSPEGLRNVTIMAATEGVKVCILGSGWEALELAATVAAYDQHKRGNVMLAFGNAGPLSHVLPRYLSTAITKRLRFLGMDIEDRALVRYLSHYKSTNGPSVEVHTAKSYDTMDTNRKVVDLVVLAPFVDGAKGTAVIPTIDLPSKLQGHQRGHTWYQSWSQLSSSPNEPSSVACFADDGRVAVNAELSAASDVYAAGSVAKYPNSLTGHSQVAGEGAVDAALAGKLAATHMIRDYIDRTKPCTPQDTAMLSTRPSPFASTTLPIFRSDISSLSGNSSSFLAKIGVQALMVGRCDSETMATHAFWWTNNSIKKSTSKNEATVRSRKTKKGQHENYIYGSGVVFYLDLNGRLCGVMTWGLPIVSASDQKTLNQALIDRMIEIVKTDGNICCSGASMHDRLLQTSHLAQESKKLIHLAMQGQGREKGVFRLVANRSMETMVRPLYRYTAAKPPNITSLSLLSRKDQALSSEIMGESIYIKKDDIYNEIDYGTRPSSLLYVYPMHSPSRGGKDDTSLYDPYLLSDAERREEAWKENDRRARPAKEEPIWLRRGEMYRTINNAELRSDELKAKLQSLYE